MRMPHYNANTILQRILTPGDLNWVQHWVSRIGLLAVLLFTWARLWFRGRVYVLTGSSLISSYRVQFSSVRYTKTPGRRTQDLRTCWQKFAIWILQNIRTSLAKKNQQLLVCGVRLHFHEHFDITFYITLHNKCVRYTTIVENCISSSC